MKIYRLATMIGSMVLALTTVPVFAANTAAQKTAPTPNLTISLTGDDLLDIDHANFTQVAHNGRHHYQRGYRNNRNNHYRFKPRRANVEYYGNRAIDEDAFAEFAQRPASGNKVFVFDPRRLKWYAYGRGGNLVASGRASGGAHYCRDVRRGCRTPVGTFSVYHKGSAYCKSNKYPLGRGGAPMPHCMFFKGGYAIHGSPDVPGHNASHGCIRVLPRAARWLHGNFIDHGTTVIVKPY